MIATVDGKNPAPVDSEFIVYLIIYKVLYIPGGARFLPSTGCLVLQKFGSNFFLVQLGPFQAG